MQAIKYGHGYGCVYMCRFKLVLFSMRYLGLEDLSRSIIATDKGINPYCKGLKGISQGEKFIILRYKRHIVSALTIYLLGHK